MEKVFLGKKMSVSNLFVSIIFVAATCTFQVNGFTVLKNNKYVGRRFQSTNLNTLPFFVEESSSVDESRKTPKKILQSRKLGSQEHLMLPRQYSPGKEDFPQMSHVSCTILSATPSTQHLKLAIESTMRSHPMLRVKVIGDGEPSERIDLFQMVRKGEPSPLTFQETEVGVFKADDVLSVVDVENDDIDASWKERFNYDLDLATIDVSEGPLWRIELHRLNAKSGDSSNDDCAILLTFNHAVSDQSSANLIMDEILGNISQLESEGVISNKGAINKIPNSLEENVLGTGNIWEDIGVSGVSTRTLQYVAGKAAEGLRNPVILPDDDDSNGKSDPLAALTTISGRAAGGEDSTSNERRSTLQFRTLSKQSSASLLEKCRENGVTMTNALSAAVALTSTDVIAYGSDDSTATRNYKVLQSLDMRRFGNEADECESVSCQAGSMDLMLGPLNDFSGASLRSGKDKNAIEKFWRLAKEGRDQTRSFIESGGPEQAVKVFDFAMTVADLNNLVHLTAKSESSKGRAYSAGISNVGVYERQKAVKREKSNDRDNLKSKHGRYDIKEIYFATSHARSGCLYQG